MTMRQFEDYSQKPSTTLWKKTVLIKILDMLISVIMEIVNYFDTDTDTDTIFEKCINDNEKFNKFINIAAFREVA